MGYRVAIDCVDVMEEKGCSIRLSGTEEEILPLAIRHFTEYHDNKDTTEFRQRVKIFLKPDED